VHDSVVIPFGEGYGAVSESEEDTLVAAAREDPAAFGALYDRYLDRVYAYLRARTNVEEDAADLTQHVFLRALRGIHDYRGGRDRFAPWLFRIARNAATDFYRRRRDSVTWDLVPAALEPITEGDLESGLLRDEDLSRLRALLATLDPERRELLALRFAAGLTIAEIGAVVGKSEEATRKRLTRTIHALQEQYHDIDR